MIAFKLPVTACSKAAACGMNFGPPGQPGARQKKQIEPTNKTTRPEPRTGLKQDKKGMNAYAKKHDCR
jgi:hypothetical protein